MRKLLCLLFFITYTVGAQEVTSGAGDSSIDDKIYSLAEVTTQPEYPGGTEEFRKYIMQNIRLPEVESDLRVKMYVDFVIGRDGRITDINVQKSPGYGLDYEVKRVLMTAKTWKPAVYKDRAVKTRYMLPVHINIIVPKIKDEKKE